MVNYLNANTAQFQNLEANIQRRLLKYINKLDEETKSDYVESDDQTFRDLDTQLNTTLTEANEVCGTTAVDRLGRLDIPGTENLQTITNDEFRAIIAKAKHFSSQCGRSSQNFENNKNSIPEAHRDGFEEYWNDLNELKEGLDRLIPQWVNERREFEEWQRAETTYTTRQADLNTEITDLRAQKAAVPAVTAAGGSKVHAANIAARAQAIQSFDNQIAQKEQARDALTPPGAQPSFSSVSELNTSMTAIIGHSGGFGARAWSGVIAAGPAAPPPPGFNQRVHNSIHKEALEKIESEAIAFLKKNTTEQWEIFQNISDQIKGATVNLWFRDTTNTSTLQMPQDLVTNQENPTNLRVIRKENDGIYLEDANNIYVITGPSVDGGDTPKQNVGVYRKTNAAGTPTPPGLGTSPDPAPEFTIGHSTPNKIGVITNMQIS